MDNVKNVTIVDYMGAIIVKQAKNDVGWTKNYQFFQTYLCNATLMSCSSRKFVLNDLYECWKKNSKLFNIINWVLVLVKDFWTSTPQNQFYKTLW